MNSAEGPRGRLDDPGSGGGRGRIPRPRAVACDLDGTLLRDDMTVSLRTRAALAAVEAAGIMLVFVTGRPPRWIHPVASQTDHRGLVICGNGALLYDLHTEEVVAQELISPETLVRVIGMVRAAVPGATFGVDYGDYFAHETAFPIGDRARTPDVRMVPASDLLRRPTAKLMVRHLKHDSDALLLAVRTVLGSLVEVTTSTALGPGLIEISAAGVSKATALARLCESQGIDAADVVAFGDMPNDLPMLAWAGRPYAMANAHRDVLAAVPGRAPSNEEDGVAAVLEELLADH